MVYLNMPDSSSQCPTNFNIMTVNNVSFCIRDCNDCVALPFETYGITYSKVCGYARGYSYFTPDAFGDADQDPNEPLSGNYVDGVFITLWNTSS